MSEFSTSYHLITSNQQNVVILLKNANLHGYVFPEKNGVVTFVVKQEPLSAFQCCAQLITHNTEPLVYFTNAEDYGWSYKIYDKHECIAQYSSIINEEELMKGFDPNHPERFVPCQDISLFVYHGFFQMERIKELLKDSMDYEKKVSIVQKSKAIVDSQNGLSKEIALDLKNEALKADEFVSEFGIFFYDWISFSYLQNRLDHNLNFHYGSFGKFPLLIV